MEALKLQFDDGTGKDFDAVVHSTKALPSGHLLSITTKDDGGAPDHPPLVVISFDVQLPDGTLRTAQFTTTVKLMRGALSGISGRYDKPQRN